MQERSVLPNGARVALSLTFDDARESQLQLARPILEAHGIHATFYVLPARVRVRRDGWQEVVAAGHEVGNHTSTHPCSANFGFSRKNGLEDKTLDQMALEIDRASDRLEMLLGVRPQTFAYPCGQSFVGRGQERTSYVPLVARRFVAGRGYGSETANYLDRCDPTHLEAYTVDGLPADALLRLLDAEGDGPEQRWVIMAGHDVGESGEQTVLVGALEALCRRAAEPDVWVAPVAEVAGRLREVRRAAPS